MPTYAYRCPVCSDQAEHERSIADRHLVVPCNRPGCQGRMKLIISAPSVRVIDGAVGTVYHSETALDAAAGGKGWRDRIRTDPPPRVYSVPPTNSPK